MPQNQNPQQSQETPDFLPLQVSMMASINFEGNIIPHTWYSQLYFQNGNVNLPAIIVLAEICYWYRPTVIRDETSGAVLGYKKKFKADKLQKNYNSFKNLGLTRQQARDAIAFLKEKNLIDTETRTVNLADGAKLPNQLFIEVVAVNIAKLNEGTFIKPRNGVCSEEQTVCSPEQTRCSTDEEMCSTDQPPCSGEQTNTENTAKTFPENTTQNTPSPKPGEREAGSKFSYEEWFEYITYCKNQLGEPIISIHAVARQNYLEGIQDSRLSAWKEEKSKKEEIPVISDEELKFVLKFCPGCYGSGREIQPGKGARQCNHSGLPEKLQAAVDEQEIDTELVKKYELSLERQRKT